MVRTWRRVALAILVALPFGLGGPSSALASSVHANCSSVIVSQTAPVRGADFGLPGTDFEGAIADANLRGSYFCDNATAYNWDEPAVLPVNIQQGGTGYIVQLGWLKCGRPGGSNCGNIPNDGNTHFVYICDDLSMGVPCDANGWAGTPIAGRRYRFRVQYNQTGTHQWDYSIKDLTTGVTKSTKVTSHWHDGTGAWWGAETHDFGSTLGPCLCGGTNQINMYWMQYWRPSIGTWQVVTDITSTGTLDVVAYYPTTPPTFVSQPSWYKNSVYTVNYNQDSVNIWTEPH